MDTEQEIYHARRFRRRAVVGLLVGALGLAGLSIGVYALHVMPPEQMVEADRIHPTCPHPECKVPHLGGTNKAFPDGTGTGALVTLYLVLCAGITAGLIRD